METVKDTLNFCNEVVFHDCKDMEIIDELKLARKGIFNIFRETIPPNKILEVLSLNDNIILGNHNGVTKDVKEDFDELRENILRMFYSISNNESVPFGYNLGS